MWKVLIFGLSAAAVVLARPSHLYTSVLPSYEHIEYAPTVVGHELHTIPTAVSHQSQTIVHEKRPYLRPIIEHTPYIDHTPYIKTYEPASSVVWPHSSYSPLPYSGLYEHGWSPSLGATFYDGWQR